MAISLQDKDLTLQDLLKSESTNDFHVAVVCASSLEAEMVEHLFDQTWTYEDLNFKQVRGDRNTYILGRIGRHNIVLLRLPVKGSINAAFAAPGLRASFPSIEVVFAVGRCGIVPRSTAGDQHRDIFLGDCVISTGIVQYDFGRLHPEAFKRKAGTEDPFSRQNPMIQSLIAEMQTDLNIERILAKTALYLLDLQRLTTKAEYPGAHKDLLFDVSYLHTHKDSEPCELCWAGTSICTRSCDALGCREIVRKRLADNADDTGYLPGLYFGQYGSGNAVVQSGTDRDRLATNDNIVAFEMEGAGLWYSFPTIILKSGCNYADSHKSKEWQPYAAATAAAAFKAFLDTWPAHALASEQT